MRTFRTGKCVSCSPFMVLIIYQQPCKPLILSVDCFIRGIDEVKQLHPVIPSRHTFLAFQMTGSCAIHSCLVMA